MNTWAGGRRMQRVQVHRTVRQWAKRELLRPGMKMIDICEALEDRVIHPFPPPPPPLPFLSSAGYHTVLPCGIPCFVGYQAVRDTKLCGIPCRKGYCTVLDVVRDTTAIRCAA